MKNKFLKRLFYFTIIIFLPLNYLFLPLADSKQETEKINTAISNNVLNLKKLDNSELKLLTPKDDLSISTIQPNTQINIKKVKLIAPEGSKVVSQTLKPPQSTQNLVSIKANVNLDDIRSQLITPRPIGPADAQQNFGWRQKAVQTPKPITELLKKTESKQLNALQDKRAKRKTHSEQKLQAIRQKQEKGIQKSSEARIVTTPEYLVFYKIQEQLTPQNQTFSISNAATATLNYTLSENTSWLDISSTSGSVSEGQEDKITLSIDTTGLSYTNSPYIADITVNNQDFPQDTKIVRARLSIFEEQGYIKVFSYDSNANLTRRITPDGYVIEYRYDKNNRLTNIYYPDATEASYAYDENSNRTSMTDSTGTTYYAYDEFNRLRAVQFPGINPIYYEYDKTGNLTKITYPNQEEITYAYDQDNRLISVTDNTGTTAYEYDTQTSNLIKKTLPNGVHTQYSYDTAKRITDVINKKSDETLISSYHYEFDANNNRTQVTETTPEGTKITNYTYDKLNRLMRADYSDGTYEAYTYDSAGNRLTKTTQDETITYEYDSDNRLIKANNTLFFYDKSGNLTKKVTPEQTILYYYDYENRLIQYQDNETTVTFQYNADGNRISKTVNGVRTYYVNDIRTPITQVLLEANLNWQVTKVYRYGLERLSQEGFGE